MTEVRLSDPISKHLSTTIAMKLERSGISTVGDLVEAYDAFRDKLAETLTERERRKVEALVLKAKKIDVKFAKAVELHKRLYDIPRITTGSKKFDCLIDPEKCAGLKVRTILELAGKPGAGKTETCATMIASAFLRVGEGGLYDTKPPLVFVVDTEGVWVNYGTMQSKVKHILKKRYGLDPSLYDENVYINENTILTTAELVQALDYILETVSRENRHALVVIDSLSAPFRAEFPGVAEMAARKERLLQVIELIRALTRNGATIIYTSQVYAVPSQFQGTQIYGGFIVGHASTIRVELIPMHGSKRGKEPRKVRAKDIPGVPSREVTIAITPLGIMDWDED